MGIDPKTNEMLRRPRYDWLRRRLPEASAECLLCNRLPWLELREWSTDANFSAILKKREKNGFLLVLEWGGDGDCVVEVAVYKDLSGGMIWTLWPWDWDGTI